MMRGPTRHGRLFMLVVSLLVVGAQATGCASNKGASSRPAEPKALAAPELTPTQIAEQAKGSIVLIRTENTIGTGFVIWQDGRIATNFHVIAGAKQVQVLLADGRELDQVQVMAVDAKRDLAVIRVPVRGLPAVSLGKSAGVRAGDRVVAVGHPMGQGSLVSDGLVSSVRVLDASLTVMQLSLPIAPGASGGPIFDTRGKVVGIATAYDDGQNQNFAMPVEYLEPMLLAENPQSLAQVARMVDYALVEGCEPEQIRNVVETLVKAIETGAPLYNQGDHAGCARTYEQTTVQLLEELKGCPAVREVLLGGLLRANQAPDASAKAWALRFVFDRILGTVRRLMEDAAEGP